MGRRVVKKVYRDTYARGQRDTKEFKDRFFARIELISIKVLEDRDLLGNAVDGSKVECRWSRRRT